MLRGGRAVIIPIWKGSFERNGGFEGEDDEIRECMPLWVSELRQTVELLRTRSDIEQEKIGFQGASFGAVWMPTLLALEPRVKAGIMILGGISLESKLAPEINPVNFAPRVTTPVLMLNGKGDPIFPYEASQVALFKMFGTPADKKRHMAFASGHSFYGWYDEMVREHHDWLDKIFGPVAPVIAASIAK